MRILAALSHAAETIEFVTVLASLSEAIKLGTLDDYSLQALANRAVYESLGTENAPTRAVLPSWIFTGSQSR
jgi:hypothetical protein